MWPVAKNPAAVALGSIRIEKHWDGNESVREASNGRIYVSQGRWQWLVIVGSEIESFHDLRRQAHQRVRELEGR